MSHLFSQIIIILGRNPSGNCILYMGNPKASSYKFQSGIAAINTVTAKNNWWGNSTGPSGAGTGTGDSVSGKVIYDPWLTTDPF
jgi:hypothetical protein